MLFITDGATSMYEEKGEGASIWRAYVNENIWTSLERSKQRTEEIWIFFIYTTYSSLLIDYLFLGFMVF
jgi:hypothetical protein